MNASDVYGRSVREDSSNDERSETINELNEKSKHDEDSRIDQRDDDKISESSALKEKAIKAINKYLVLKGYKILDKLDNYIDIVAQDNETIVFIKIKMNLDQDRLLRDECEAIAGQWFVDHKDVIDMNFRFDEISINVLSGDRAMLRHGINLKLEERQEKACQE